MSDAHGTIDAPGPTDAPGLTGAATARIHELMPLCRTLGIVAEDLGPSSVALSIGWDEPLCTGGGLLHGGVIMALADSAAGACAFLNLPASATGTSTIESKTNFLGAVTTGTVTARATPLHVGRSTIVVETELRDDSGRLVAKVTQTQAVLGPRPAS
jgi:1,4-dihydroxy-2-naphthoyl-CoA hydrolase